MDRVRYVLDSCINIVRDKTDLQSTVQKKRRKDKKQKKEKKKIDYVI